MAWYSTGTVAVTSSSGTVTGTGTQFIANVRVGDAFIGPDGLSYEVTGVASNTSLTIGPNYRGSTASGQAYRIQPTQGRIVELTQGVNDLLTRYTGIADGPGSGKFADGTAAAPSITFGADQDTGMRRPGANQISLVTGGLDRIFINGASVGINTTNPTSTLDVAGTIKSTADFILGSASATHYIVRPDVVGAKQLAFAVQGASTLDAVMFNTAIFRPWNDNVTPNGTPSQRWSTVYAGTSTISTSDQREKTWLGSATAQELAAGKEIIAELGFFQWNDAIAKKGEGAARWHFGVRAQQVWAIMARHGLIDALGPDGLPTTPDCKYAFLCYDAWEQVIEQRPIYSETLLDAFGQPLQIGSEATIQQETGNRFGVRIDQLALFLIAVQQADIAAAASERAALSALISTHAAGLDALEGAGA